jgi:hypothetical protein
MEVASIALATLVVAVALRLSAPECPREERGYTCKRGSGYKCECER